jgi:hypothetical protein
VSALNGLLKLLKPPPNHESNYFNESTEKKQAVVVKDTDKVLSP